MPNPTKIVAKTLAAMRREGDLEKLEVAILFGRSLKGCVDLVLN